MTYQRLICAACLTMLMPMLAEAQAKLVFSTFPDADTPNIVIAERVLREAYGRLGITLEAQYLPGARGFYMANLGETDGELFHVAGLEQTYSNLHMLPVPVFSADIVAVTKDAHFEVNGWESLRPYTIGIVRGFTLAEDHTVGMQVELVNEQEQLLQKVVLGRTDLAIDSRLTLLFAIKKLKLTGLTILEPPLDTIYAYHYLHKKHQNLLPQLEQVLRQMESEGAIRRVQAEVSQQLLEDIAGAQTK